MVVDVLDDDVLFCDHGAEDLMPEDGGVLDDDHS